MLDNWLVEIVLFASHLLLKAVFLGSRFKPYLYIRIEVHLDHQKTHGRLLIAMLQRLWLSNQESC